MRYQKKPKKRIKYRTGDIILLGQDAFTKEQALSISKMLKKPVIWLPDVKDLSSISTADLRAVLKMREQINATQTT